MSTREDVARRQQRQEQAFEKFMARRQQAQRIEDEKRSRQTTSAEELHHQDTRDVVRRAAYISRGASSAAAASSSAAAASSASQARRGTSSVAARMQQQQAIPQFSFSQLPQFGFEARSAAASSSSSYSSELSPEEEEALINIAIMESQRDRQARDLILEQQRTSQRLQRDLASGLMTPREAESLQLALALAMSEQEAAEAEEQIGATNDLVSEFQNLAFAERRRQRPVPVPVPVPVVRRQVEDEDFGFGLAERGGAGEPDMQYESLLELRDVEVPLSRRTLNSLPKCSYNAQRDSSCPNCAICLCDFEHGEPDLLFLPRCQHVFHRGCVTNWFQRSKKCPICRIELE